MLMPMRGKKLLIAGGGLADVPQIEAAKRLGFHVITSGCLANDMGHKYSDECHLVDYSDKEAMLRLAQSLDIDAVCSCCNDFSALTASYIAEKMGLPGHDPFDVATVLHHKDLYRDFALSNGIASPVALGFSSVSEALASIGQFRFPVIVKPVDLTGGKGISTVAKPEDVEAALNFAFKISRAKRVVIEEFLEGTRHGASTFVRDGKIVFSFFDNEYYYKNDFLVSAASGPADLSSSAIADLYRDAEKIVSLLKLKTGILHIQFILCNGKPVILEVCRRPPGDLYTLLVSYATGIDYSEFIVRALSGMDCTELSQGPSRGFYTRHCVMPPQNGVVKGVQIDERVQKNVVDSFMWWQPGDVVHDYKTHKCGIVFLRFSSLSEMLSDTLSMNDLIRVQV